MVRELSLLEPAGLLRRIVQLAGPVGSLHPTVRIYLEALQRLQEDGGQIFFTAGPGAVRCRPAIFS